MQNRITTGCSDPQMAPKRIAHRDPSPRCVPIPQARWRKMGRCVLPVWVKPEWVLRLVSGLQTMGLGLSQSLGSTLDVCGPGHMSTGRGLSSREPFSSFLQAQGSSEENRKTSSF